MKEGEEISPFQKLYGHKPNIELIRPFGCHAFAHICEEGSRINRENKRKERKTETLDQNLYGKDPQPTQTEQENNNKETEKQKEEQQKESQLRKAQNC